MSDSNTTPTGNGHASKATIHARKSIGKAEQHDTAALIEQATKLRTSLHDLLHEASSLVKALKQHRRQSRAIQTTLASLKQFKTLGV